MNKSSAHRISIDLPSGLNADTGVAKGEAIHAELTATMAFRKSGLLVGSAGSHVGDLFVVDIGIPPIVPKKIRKDKTWRVTAEAVRNVLPRRPINAHKHSVGKLLVIAGSPGFTGAASLSSLSAMRSGAGTVMLATPEPVYPVLARKLSEVMVDPLPSTASGSLSLQSLPKIVRHLTWADHCLIGPGLSRDDETVELIVHLLAKVEIPTLVDADGLNALSANVNLLRKRRSAPLVLTPHTGEFSRISGEAAKDIEENRIEASRAFAKRFGVVLVLKGAPTVTATADKQVFINSTGNPGMATAGAGDVLAGCISGLWAQHMDCTDAAVAGVYAHGLAGDLAAEEYGMRSLVASDILSMLPNALAFLEGRKAGLR